MEYYSKVTFQYEYVFYEYPESQILKTISWKNEHGEDAADIMSNISELQTFLAKKGVQCNEKSTIFNKVRKLMSIGETTIIQHQEIKSLQVDFEETNIRIQATVEKGDNKRDSDYEINYDQFNKITV